MNSDFLSLVNSRQSDRQYDSSRPVEQEKLDRILEAARLAPSACNGQPWHFVVLTDPDKVKQAGKAAAGLGMNRFAADAPVLILVVEEHTNAEAFAGKLIKKRDFALLDIGIAASHIVLAAESEGLGSCIMGWFDEKKIKDIAGVPGSKRIQLVISLGYTDTPKRRKVRKKAETVITYNRY